MEKRGKKKREGETRGWAAEGPRSFCHRLCGKRRVVNFDLIRTAPRTGSHLSVNRVAHGIHALVVLLGGKVGDQLSIADDHSGRLLVARVEAVNMKEDMLDGLRLKFNPFGQKAGGVRPVEA